MEVTPKDSTDQSVDEAIGGVGKVFYEESIRHEG